VYSALDLHFYKRYWGEKERDCIIGECTSKRVVYRGLLWWKGLKRRVKAFIWAMAWLGHDSLCQLSTNSSRNKAKHSLLYLQGYTILKTCNIINMLDQSNHFKSLVSSNRSTHLREREREREREILNSYPVHSKKCLMTKGHQYSDELVNGKPWVEIAI
jgi:hypothetical protein